MCSHSSLAAAEVSDLLLRPYRPHDALQRKMRPRTKRDANRLLMTASSHSAAAHLADKQLGIHFETSFVSTQHGSDHGSNTAVKTHNAAEQQHVRRERPYTYIRASAVATQADTDDFTVSRRHKVLMQKTHRETR
eukprot:GHVU01092249.1.p1 GENE.GHVU01092249.1~~GHVU01092249.1.p1  ORF type:complete len:135 (-),score=8.14 GHVU01092249.1:574-978(-)